MAVVWIPSLMRDLTGGQARVTVPGATVRQVVNNLETAHAGIRERLMDEERDRIKPTIAVIVDGETTILGLMEPVGEESEVHFLPAIGGGR